MMDMAVQGSTYAKDNSGDPTEVARYIQKICLEKKPAFYHPIGKGIKTLLFLKKVLPWTLMENVLIKRTS